MSSVYDLISRSEEYLEGYKCALLDSANSLTKWEELLENVNVAIDYQKYHKYNK